MSATTRPKGPRRDAEARFDWTLRYPERRVRELAALAPLCDGVEETRAGLAVVWLLDYRLPDDLRDNLTSRGSRGSRPGDVVRLEVRFPAEYPFFAPAVLDRANTLALERHRDPSGALCLSDQDTWHLDTTVADLLSTQIPKVLATNDPHQPPPPGTEEPAGEGMAMNMTDTFRNLALLMPTVTIPEGVTQGTTVICLGADSEFRPSVVVVELIRGEGFVVDVAPPAIGVPFHLVVEGRWVKDPTFDPRESAESTFNRVDAALPPHGPIAVTSNPDEPASGEPRLVIPEALLPRTERAGVPCEDDGSVQVLCLLVPSERDYRTRGEEWVAILRIQNHCEVQVHYLRVQVLRDDCGAIRTPPASRLRGTHVVVVGVGALGSHVAQDLARTGVGHLDLVDGDTVDVATARRQYAPLHEANHNKAQALSTHLRAQHPEQLIRSFDDYLGVPATDDQSPEEVIATRRARTDLQDALAGADLVIDTTAAPAVTTYLAATRHHQKVSFLHASATAGAWGGSIYLAVPGTGCWACLQHHRLSGTVPVPPADPTGLIYPPGCGTSTFTGINPDLATIAHHGSRVAIDHLTHTGGLGEGGELFTAELRDPDTGQAVPARWHTTPIPVHPACPLHDH